MTRSKIISGLVAVSALFAGVAFAANIDSSIGNTVVMTGADGAKTEFRNAADGTMKVTLPDGSATTGKWKVEGDKLVCTDDKDGKVYTYDISGAEHKTGDKWDGKDANGNAVTFELVAGQ